MSSEDWKHTSGGRAAHGGEEDNCLFQGMALEVRTKRGLLRPMEGLHSPLWKAKGEKSSMTRGFRRGNGAQGEGKRSEILCVCGGVVWMGRGIHTIGKQVNINHDPHTSSSGGPHRILLGAGLSLGLGISKLPRHLGGCGRGLGWVLLYKVSVEWLREPDKKCDSSGSAENVGQDWDQGWCFLSPIHWGEQAERAPSTKGLVWCWRSQTARG